MRKSFSILVLGACVALGFTSCKSSESAYKKAYEKAKQQELAETKEAAPTQTTETVARVESAPVRSSAPVASDARQERVSVVSGSGLQDYSVVCGSFGVKTNADNLKSYLDGEGYSSLIVYNADKNMYRVIVGTYSDYGTAAQARDAFKAKYPNRQDFQGSWLLYRIN